MVGPLAHREPTGAHEARADAGGWERWRAGSPALPPFRPPCDLPFQPDARCASSSGTMVSPATLHKALPYCLEHTDFRRSAAKYEGKVRDNYTRDGRALHRRDRPHQRVRPRARHRSRSRARCSTGWPRWWFEKTKDVAANHMLGGARSRTCSSASSASRSSSRWSCARTRPGTTSTSLWTHYERGVRVFCGHRLPDGLKKHQKLPAPILTPTTKAPKGEHDVSRLARRDPRDRARSRRRTSTRPPTSR